MSTEKEKTFLYDSKETVANNSTNLVINSIEKYNQNGYLTLIIRG